MRYNKRYLRLTLCDRVSVPRASVVFMLKLWSRLKWAKPVEGSWAFPVELTLFFGNYLTRVDIRIVLYHLEYFHSFLIFRHWALLKTRIRGFHANFHFAALTSPLQLLLVLCPPPLSFELASSALCWLVVSVAPQIEHMFDLRSTRSTPFKYRAPVATWDRLHI